MFNRVSENSVLIGHAVECSYGNKSTVPAVLYMIAGGPETATVTDFERQLQTIRPQLLRYALWLSRDRAIAEDVVQESLLRAWKARAELTELSALRQWLYTIVRREHARLYERKRLETVDVDVLVVHESPELAVSGEEELLSLRRAIAGLTTDYRVPLTMQVLGGFSTQEIAAELGLTQPAVLTRLFRARAQLRGLLGATTQGDRP
jgi:RNA polymerase sigma-70 factor, ECF subfamily